jgi:asparagine synthetase B (glutamine-hydrolysing)
MKSLGGTMDRVDLKKKIKAELINLEKKTGGINLMLSGGVDSSVLAALGDPQRVYTVRLPFGPKHDEFEDVMRVVNHLKIEDRLTVVDLDLSRFDEVMVKAVKAIGRPIPHYNIFPLYCLFEKISQDGIKDITCGDGPDETMCGYTRQLIMWYLYNAYLMEAFEQYHGMIGKVLLPPDIMYAKLIGKDQEVVCKIFEDNYKKGGNLLDSMCLVDMALMRPDMDDMSNKLASLFGITIHRPYQDTSIDDIMFRLRPEEKVTGFEYGKYLLREVAADLLPGRIAWRRQKIGGPVIPVNEIKGWKLDPFDKSMYLQYQEDILNG